MIVVDASAVIELVLQTRLGARVEARVFRAGETMHAPHLLDVEVTQALRRITLRGEMVLDRAWEAISDLQVLGIVRHTHSALVKRVFELRDNLSAYDAMYVALAEALDATVVTCDRPLASAPGHVARIEVIA